MSDVIQIIFNMIPSILMIVAPILIAATGGMICERSGVTNIALEGLMTIGAMTAAVIQALLESAGSVSLVLACVLAAVMGGGFLRVSTPSPPSPSGRIR